VRIGQLENLDDLADLIAQVKQGGSFSAPGRSAQAPRPVVPEKKNEVAPVPASVPQTSEVLPTDLSPPQVDALWKEALASLGDMTAEFARLADSVTVAGPNRLVARFRAEYTLNKESCERPEKKARLESALSQAAGRTIRLDLEVVAGTSAVEPRPIPVLTRGQQMKETQRHPLVRKAIEMFDGDVLRTDSPRKSAEDRS